MTHRQHVFHGDRNPAARAALSSPLALVLAALLSAPVGCAKDDQASPLRKDYNDALKDFEKGSFEDSDQGFREARDKAGQDVELRFRAAFNLGLSLAQQVSVGPQLDSMEPKDLEAARAKLEESASWFRTAVHLRPDERDARVNLEIVSRRIIAISDRLNKGENSLEKRLDKVIEGQRGLRDQVRGLTAAVAQSGNAASPVEFQEQFDALATSERGLLSDLNIITDLAGEELSLLQDKGGPDGESLEDQDKVRVVQLTNLDFYLQRARSDLADTRRTLRRLQGESAHRRADGGLRFLVRAREQLLDPVTVLKSIAQDQARLMQQTGVLVQLDKGAFTIQGTPEGQPPPQIQAPPWLNDDHLGDRQDGALQRTREVLARFENATTQEPADPANPDQPDGAQAAPQDPKQARTLEAARDSVPFLKRATEAMESSRTALGQGEREASTERQRDALVALAAAIERFSGIREIIELIHGDHLQTLVLLTPPDQLQAQLQAQMQAQPGAHGDIAAQVEQLTKMPMNERIALLERAAGQNIERLARLQGLFEDEIATIEAQAAQQAAQAAQNAQGGDPQQQAQAIQQQTEAAKQQYVQAEELRQKVLESLTGLSVTVTAIGAGAGGQAKAAEAMALGEQAKTDIEELRRLFYSLIEHLKELIQEQTKTNDLTGSAASAVETEELLARLGPALAAQREHAAMGEPLTNAVAQQADAASQGGDEETVKRLSEATEELRSASEQMSLAETQMTEDLEAAKSMSVDLSTALEAQRTAIGHLEAALALLQPPQQNQNQDQQQQNPEQQEKQEQQDVNQRQAQQRLQEIRDREAQRRRDKKQSKPEPVDKDW